MKDNTPLVSILIPAYNVQEYIGKCLDSVLGQTYTNIEVVIVDDGSTDITADIIADYAARDERIVLVRKENGGVMAARQDTVAAAKGEYLYFMDSDDYISDECIEKMMAVMHRENCDIVSTPLVRIKNAYSSIIKQDVPQTVDEYGYLGILLSHRIFTSLAGKIYRRELFDDLLFDNSISLWDDYFLNLQVALKRPKVYFMIEGLYYYIQRESSLNRSYHDVEYIENFLRLTGAVLDKYPEVKAKYHLLILQDKLHWFYIYAKKSRNKWVGNTEFAKVIREEVRQNKKELKEIIPMAKINSILFYRRRILYPLVLILAMVDRMQQSFRRRKI